MDLIVVGPITLIGLTGLAAVFVGWRGRRVGDHPHCRRCGFDLVGAADRAVCSECGADLTVKGATRVGQHRRRPGVLIAGALAFLFAGGLLGAALFQDFGSQAMKLTWWLRWEASGSDSVVAEAALTELNRRMDNRQISAATMSGLAKDALAIQGQVAKPWLVGWGDLIQKARKAGAVSDADWETYALQAVESGTKFTVRPKVRHGDPIPYRRSRDGSRVGSNNTFGWRLTLNEFQVGALRWSGGGSNSGTLSPYRNPSTSSTVDIKPLQWNQIAIGPTKFIQRGEMTIVEGQGASAPVLLKRMVTRTVPIEIVPADAQVVTLKADPSLDAAVRNAVKVQQLWVEQSTFNGDLGLKARISIDNPPVDVAFDVMVQVGDQAWRLGGIDCQAGVHATFTVPTTRIEGLTADRVNVELRPSVEQAVRDVDLIEIWGEPVLIPDQAVRWTVPKP